MKTITLNPDQKAIAFGLFKVRCIQWDFESWDITEWEKFDQDVRRILSISPSVLIDYGFVLK